MLYHICYTMWFHYNYSLFQHTHTVIEVNFETNHTFPLAGSEVSQTEAHLARLKTHSTITLVTIMKSVSQKQF